MCDLPALATLTLANFYFLALAFVSASFFGFWFFFFFVRSASFKKRHHRFLHTYSCCTHFWVAFSHHAMLHVASG